MSQRGNGQHRDGGAETAAPKCPAPLPTHHTQISSFQTLTPTGFIPTRDNSFEGWYGRFTAREGCASGVVRDGRYGMDRRSSDFVGVEFDVTPLRGPGAMTVKNLVSRLGGP